MELPDVASNTGMKFEDLSLIIQNIDFFFMQKSEFEHVHVMACTFTRPGPVC